MATGDFLAAITRLQLWQPRQNLGLVASQCFLIVQVNDWIEMFSPLTVKN